MAVLYVFPVANTEFIQFNDQNNDYITSIHYSELSFGLDNNTNVQFSHRRESAQLFPIQAAPFAEVLNEAGTPYSAVSLDAFIAAFTAALPLSGAAAGGGGGSAPDIALTICSTTKLQVHLCECSRRLTLLQMCLHALSLSLTALRLMCLPTLML